MKQKLHGSFVKYGIGLLAIALCIFSAATSSAVPLIWDPTGLGGGGGGGGAWDGTGTTANWYDSTLGLPDVVWTAGGDAEFDNTAGTVAVAAGGVTVHNMTFNVTNYLVTTGAANSITLSGTTPTITVNGSTNIANFGTGTSNPGIIAGTAGLTKDGLGTLNFDSRGGSNTYTGGTTILAGTFQTNREGAFGATPLAMDYSNIVMKQGTTLKYGLTTSPSTFRGIRLDGTGATATFNQTVTGTLTWAAPITGTGGLNIITSGSFRPGSGLFTYSGDTVIKSGTLSLGTANPLPYASNPNNGAGGTTGNGGGNVYVWSAGIIFMNNQNMQINGLNDGLGTSNGAGSVSQTGSNNRTLTLGDNNANGSFSGAITGAHLNITKIGVGTQTLSGAAISYGLITGAASAMTTVSAGTLYENGSIGSLTVQNGASFSPISTILSSSTLNVQGSLNIASGSTEILDINSATAYDQLNVNVPASTGTTAGTVALAGTLAVNLGYAPAPTDKFWIINNDLADAVTGTFTGLAEGATVFTSGGTPWAIYYDADFSTLNLTPGSGNDVVIAPIPEPAALAMLFTALAAMGGWSIVRKQRSK